MEMLAVESLADGALEIELESFSATFGATGETADGEIAAADEIAADDEIAEGEAEPGDSQKDGEGDGTDDTED